METFEEAVEREIDTLEKLKQGYKAQEHGYTYLYHLANTYHSSWFEVWGISINFDSATLTVNLTKIESNLQHVAPLIDQALRDGWEPLSTLRSDEMGYIKYPFTQDGHKIEILVTTGSSQVCKRVVTGERLVPTYKLVCQGE